ncbi:MAG TPA: sodium:calcium antiporter, partial [Bacteroidetes bacterium]|nr:sodium:calcium antiporter [Bacteroidota bacterium]
YILRVARNQRRENGAATVPRYRLPTALLLLLVGLAALIAGGQALVEGGVWIARHFGVPDWLIGVSVVAIGTSAPEIAASVVAALRGRGDIAVGNVLGSNVFNVLMVLGCGATVRPLAAGVVIHGDLLLLAGISLFALLFLGVRQRMPRSAGGLLLAAYVGYIMVRVIHPG